jgi:hypothetical protein
MSATISEKKGWVITREAFDRMLTGLHPDSEQAGQQSHCLYKIIDAVRGYLYPQPATFSRRPCGKLPSSDIRNTFKIPLDFLNSRPTWPFENPIER